ncbi:restriction endonuclease subunit S [Xanthobacter sediminis]
MSGLPKGWVAVTLSEAVERDAPIIYGILQPGPYVSAGIPYVRPTEIMDNSIDTDALRRTTPDIAERYRRSTLAEGDVLLSIVGTIGKVAIVPAKLAGANITQSSCRIRPRSSLTGSSFISHFLRSPLAIGQFDQFRLGTAVPRLNLEDVRKIELPLPPLPEQRRIVAKIDSLTAKSRRARDHLDHIPRLVEKYKQAILAAAFRGDLTREWRGERDAGHWAATTAGSIIRDIVGGKNLRCEERPPMPHELGVVKVSAVTWGAFDATASKTLPSDFSPAQSSRIRSGDLLISRANTLELVGAVVIVGEVPENLCLSDKVLRLEMDDADKRWLMWFLRSPLGRSAIEAGATGNQLSMRNLSQSALRSIELPWPAFEERAEIVRRIEAAFAWINRLATEATSARKLIDRLDQAVLAKAFRGELVPQDPADEPASVLLNRIRAERGTAPKARRGRRPAAEG